MNTLMIIVGLLVLPMVILMFIVALGAIYYAWIVLFALCGFKWAQHHWKELQ